MKQTIPFKKDIVFKSKIGELTGISLENDLTLKGEDLIVGNFYISGTYKMLEGSLTEEEYSYKIPCEIAISDDYDTFDATIDIDDFYYEIINEEVLRVNIVVVINNLERKAEDEYLSFLTDKEDTDDIEEVVMEKDEIEELVSNVLDEEKRCDDKIFSSNDLEEVKILDNIPEIDKVRNSFIDASLDVKKQEDTYLTYKVYIFKKEDTINSVIDKYKITKEQLLDYNNLDDIKEGCKLVIPSFND